MQLLRIADVSKKVGLCKSRIYAVMKTEGFPQPVQLSAKSVAWVNAEVDAWIEQRLAARNLQTK